MARGVKNAFDHDRVVVGCVEDRLMTMDCDPHARAVLFAERVPGGELSQAMALGPKFVNEAQRGFRTVRGDMERNL
jgi:hypothetical protein